MTLGTEDCQAQLAAARQRAAEPYVACVTTQAADTSAVPDQAALQAARQVWRTPAWCDDHGVANAWYIDRTRGCGIFRAKLTVRDARTGREIGGITYLITGYHFTARDARTWAYQVQLMEVSRWGTGVSGTTVSGSASCTGKCKVRSSDFPRQAITANKEPFGQFFMDTTINTAARNQKGTGTSVASWRFANPAWATPSNSTRLATTDVRCDNALPGTTRQVGCVNPGYIPVVSYSTTGPWPELAKHIRYAQDTRRLPGKFGTSRYLIRLTDTAKIKKNRKKACPSSRPRPAGKSCDEYPFASTWQGARTGDGKYSWRMINETQNIEGGRALNGFYTYSRILEKDKFLVWIR
ncbi:NucA/NucB deoxyribonuclease domain-containing protein [Streptomyces uncialis]|uniref:NucA/NucB deoxyribonuclease domain-containing protein n=1 Tax=Streptomyces uncialis TaxID=1048205 RepID=UPI00386BC4CB|nr:NucA/NucB deoxyribonuclease domain-containing protein [Streptomyces uncialis]